MRNPDGSEKENEEADHRQRMRDFGGHGKVLSLRGREHAADGGVNGHRHNAAQGAEEKRETRPTIVCHVRYCRGTPRV